MRKSFMPSMASRLIALFMGVVFLYSSCSFEIDDEPPKPQLQEQIANQIRKLDTEEILRSLDEFKAENPEITLNDEEEQMLDLFLNNPQKALELIAQEENGEAILKLIGVMFNEGTVDEAVQALEILDPEKAEEFVGFLDEIAATLNMENEPVNITDSRAILSRPNIRNLSFITTK